MSTEEDNQYTDRSSNWESKNSTTISNVDLSQHMDLLEAFKETTKDILRIADLSVIIFSGILFFITNLSIIANKWINKEDNKLPLKGYNFFAILTLCLGIFLVFCGDYKNPADIENNNSFVELQQKVANNKLLIDNFDNKIKIIKNNIPVVSSITSENTKKK